MHNKLSGSLGMKSRLLTGLMVALIANGTAIQGAHAQLVTTLDPGSFAAGTNVSNAFAGVSLSSFSVPVVGSLTSGLPLDAPNYAPVYATNPDGPASTALPTLVFSSSPSIDFGFGGMWGGISGSCFSQCSPPDRPDFFGTNLLVSFGAPVTSVSVLNVGDIFNGVYIEAFDSSNQTVGFCETAFNPQAIGNYGCYSVLNQGGEGSYEIQTSVFGSSSSGISKILIGGYNNDFSMSTIKYTAAAPEIDPTSAASGLTLLLGGLLILRGRRITARRT
jgi:hypothetical protein